MKKRLIAGFVVLAWALKAHALVFDVDCAGACGPSAVALNGATVCTVRVGEGYYGDAVVRVEGVSAVAHHATGDEALLIPDPSLPSGYFPLPIIAKPGERAPYPTAVMAEPDDTMVTVDFEAHGVKLYLTPTGEGPCENMTIPGYGPYVQCRYPEVFDEMVTRSFAVLPAGSCPVTSTTLPPNPPPPPSHGHGCKGRWGCK